MKYPPIVSMNSMSAHPIVSVSPGIAVALYFSIHCAIVGFGIRACMNSIIVPIVVVAWKIAWRINTMPAVTSMYPKNVFGLIVISDTFTPLEYSILR